MNWDTYAIHDCGHIDPVDREAARDLLSWINWKESRPFCIGCGGRDTHWGIGIGRRLSRSVWYKPWTWGRCVVEFQECETLL